MSEQNADARWAVNPWIPMKDFHDRRELLSLIRQVNRLSDRIADKMLPNDNERMSPPEVKILGKLLEELGELQSAAARCLIQGMDEREPVTGKQNRLWLQEELADVDAGIRLAAVRVPSIISVANLLAGRMVQTTTHFNLDFNAIILRSEAKEKRLKLWHEMET